jgi:hypothetical protein
MATMRRPGRPPLDPDHPSTAVNLRLPSSEYDALFQIARREHVSVPEIIRRHLASHRRDDDDVDESYVNREREQLRVIVRRA